MNLNKTLTRSAGSVALRITIIVAAAIGGAALVSTSVFAALTATATNTSGGSISTGTLSLTLAPSSVSGITGGFTSAITGMAPGDTVNRYIDLTNGGTLDGATPTLQITDTPTTSLTTNATAGLQITISNCTVAWSSSGTCSGTTSVVLASTPASTLKSGATAITLPSTLAGSVSRLKISINLPSGNENVLNGVLPVGTVQGVTTALTWSFTITERAAVESNS